MKATIISSNATVAAPQPVPFCFIFGAGSVPADLAAGMLTNLLIVRKAGTLTGWTAVVTGAATGAAVILDVLLNGSTIFTTKPTIPVSTTSVQSGTGFTGTVTVAPGDTLQGTVTQIGSGVPGKGATLELDWS